MARITSISWQFKIAATLSSLVLAASLVDNLFVHYLDSDVSWLLVVADRMIAGEKLYVDLWEVNPPFSVFLYYPAVYLQRMLGIKAEFLVGVFGYLWTFCCLGFAAYLARRMSIWLFPLGLFLALLSIPQTFAQREFFGIIGTLPVMAIAALRHESEKVRVGPAVTAGILGAVMILIKPHYALGPALVYGYLALRSRLPRLLIAPEVMVQVVIVVIYAIIVIVFFPEYFLNLVPILVDLYSDRASLNFLLINSPLLPAIGLVVIYAFYAFTLKHGAHRVFALFFAGYLIAFLSMGKGFANHALPMMVAGGLMIGLAATD